MKSKTMVKHVASLAGLLVFVILAIGSVDDSSSSSSGARTKANSTNSGKGQWFQGGNLHNATVGQWRRATYANKLATAADWLSATKWKGHLNSPSDFDRIKMKAQMLVNAVDEVVTVEGTDSMQVNELAAAILTMSNDLGP